MLARDPAMLARDPAAAAVNREAAAGELLSAEGAMIFVCCRWRGRIRQRERPAVGLVGRLRLVVGT